MLDEVSDSAVGRRRGAKEHNGCLCSYRVILNTIQLAVWNTHMLTGDHYLPLCCLVFTAGC